MRPPLLAAALSLSLAVALTGCGYDPSGPRCSLRCGSGGECPSGQTCLADSFCHADDADSLCDDVGVGDANPRASEDARPCTPELCNGLDDDCDGSNDEDFDVGADCDGEDADACLDGRWACGTDGTASCDDDDVSIAEDCGNDVDDDCDGAVDCADQDCAPDARCCTGNGLVGTIPDGCLTDGGDSSRNDTLEIYCCGNVARFCLSGESCPWRAACIDGPATCSRGGLSDDFMASASCSDWKGETQFACGADQTIYFF